MPRGLVTFLVTLKLPPGATVGDAQTYVLNAVMEWAGSLQPSGVDEGGPNPEAQGDPMFHLDRRSVKVEPRL